MMHKAWCSTQDMPYYISRSSIKFQSHTGWKNDDLNPIWERLLGRSQLSNPSDLPCSQTKTNVLLFLQIGWSDLLAKLAKQHAEKFNCTFGHDKESSVIGYSKLTINGKNGNNHYKEKTVWRPSYLYNGNSITWKTVFLFTWGPGTNFHDDVMKWKLFPRYWPFVRGILRWPVGSPYKGLDVFLELRLK